MCEVFIPITGIGISICSAAEGLGVDSLGTMSFPGYRMATHIARM